jgi:putative peptide zinc metalloprotease protein
VAAAGIVVELAIAALGLVVALVTEPGALCDLALVAFAIGALSTLLVNANPLMRFDGYHMLCDALELPNLALRSSRHWHERLRARLLGLRREASVVPAAGETPWLWAYAPAALVLRWAVALAAVNWLGSISFALGIAIALYFGWMLLAKPLLALLRLLHGPALQEAERSSARKRTRWIGLALLLPLTALPLPHSTVVQGVLWLPEQALVRAQTEGFVEQVLVADGQPVQAGDPLLTLRAPALLADQERAAGSVQALQSERYLALRDDPARAVAVEHELQAASAELERLDQRVEQLTVRAQLAGNAVIAHASDLPGRFVSRGTLLGHLLTDAPGIVRVAIAQDRAALISAHRGAVEVRLADPGSAPLRGQLIGAPSGGGALLPSAALGERSGGRIAVAASDRHGLTPVQPVLLADVRLEQPTGDRIGERALVRFEHGRAPIAWQAARALQQQVLEHFNPAQ